MMSTQIRDAGQDTPRTMPNGWGWWHVHCLQRAIEAEGGEWKQAFDPGWTFTTMHTFVDDADGEIFKIDPGDTFLWWWS